jgi:hypothetical protein
VHETFARRFRGPLASANGGYACGRLAAHVEGDTVEVTLRLPPPLERRLDVREEVGGAVLLDGDSVVAEARAAVLDVEPPAFVSVDDADEARERAPRAWEADFQECFVCGERPDGDGLRLHVGPVGGREPLHAAPWHVSESAPEIVWAAIDCPGAYAVGGEGRGTIVLGRMTARVSGVPDVGETCVVTAWPLGEDGRKLYAGTALFAEDGELLALAKQVWIEPRASAE